MFIRPAPVLAKLFLSYWAMVATAVAQQTADPHFDARVDKPTFTKTSRAYSSMKPITTLIQLTIVTSPSLIYFSMMAITLPSIASLSLKASLASHKILVIVNPLGSEDTDDEGAAGPAFTPAECEVVSDWVRGGGALLLIADLAPFASAAEILAKQLGVDMSKSETTDAANADERI